MRKVFGVFPDSIDGHVEAGAERLAPVWGGGGFAPVVGDLRGLAVMDFGDGDA